MVIRKSLVSSISVLIICLLAGVFAYSFKGNSGLSQVTLYLIYGLFAMSVDLLWGYSGMLSFGQAVFFGLGGFAYAWTKLGTIVDIPWDNSGLLGLLAALVIPALFSLCIGYFLFYGKISGHNFTIVMLALSFMMQLLALGWNKVFGGFTGLAHVPSISINLGGQTVSAGIGLAGFIFVALVCVVVTLLLRLLLELPFGIVLDGLRDNERRLEFLGVNIASIKLTVFVISAAVAGIAGGLYASSSQYVAYDSMGIMLSTEVLIWVAVGGRRSLVGAFLGAVIVRFVSYLLSGVALSYWMLFLGILFIVVVLAGSTGIMGVLNKGYKLVQERRVQRVAGS